MRRCMGPLKRSKWKRFSFSLPRTIESMNNGEVGLHPMVQLKKLSHVAAYDSN
jgi:hypothetical protein